MKPRALDLFCGAGGASMGLHRAGFDVVGCDIRKQPRYPFRFVQANALNPPFRLADFGFIWASPPCQAFTVAAANHRAQGYEYPDHIAATRALLSDHPLTCMENVPRAPIRPDLKLDGWMFPELRTVRERWFELSWFQMGGRQGTPRGLNTKHGYICVVGSGTASWLWRRGVRYTVADYRHAMDINWMSRKELSQAVPPAYAEYIGRAALAYLGAKAAA